ncbi:MAG: adenylyl-sulfate kinase [Candidatus Kerfeldbacteria bacterium]
MVIDADFLRKHIDFTLIHPYVSVKEIRVFCQRAIENRVRTIYVPPVFVKLAIDLVLEHGIVVGTTVGFPYGNQHILPRKIMDMHSAWCSGARWVDVCLNVSLIRNPNPLYLLEEVKDIVQCARVRKIGLKIIIESPFLRDVELATVTQFVELEKVDFLKTATGVGNRVSEAEVLIIKQHLKNTKLKVAGGITTFDDAKRFFELGADVIGSSRGFAILEEAQRDSVSEREVSLLAHPVIWLTGQTGSGKTTLAKALHAKIGGMVLDGDEVRRSIGRDLGLGIGDRIENNRRIASFARFQAQYGLVIVAVISPLERIRREVDLLVHPQWVYVERDVPITDDSPFEPPSEYLIKVNSDEQTTDEQVACVMRELKNNRVIK